MYNRKHTQQTIVKSFLLLLSLFCITTIHAQQKTPDMSRFTSAPIKQDGGGQAARVAKTTVPASQAALPSDQPAQAAANAANAKVAKPVNKTAAPSGPGMEQMSMQPAPEAAKPKPQPVKVPTQQN